MKDKTFQSSSLISAGKEPGRSPPAAGSFRFNGMALQRLGAEVQQTRHKCTEDKCNMSQISGRNGTFYIQLALALRA